MQGNFPGAQPNAAMQGMSNKYKTSICRHFETTGTCHLGDRCNYAHGIQELRGTNDVLFSYIPN